MTRRAWAAVVGGFLVAAVAGVAVGVYIGVGDKGSPSQAQIAAGVREALASTTTSTPTTVTSTSTTVTSTSTTVTSTTTTVTRTTLATTTVPPTTAAPVRTTPPPTAAPIYGPGYYQVGLDMPAGTYRTTDEDCYWAEFHKLDGHVADDFEYGASSFSV